jgi:hypothetical protein
MAMTNSGHEILSDITAHQEKLKQKKLVEGIQKAERYWGISKRHLQTENEGTTAGLFSLGVLGCFTFEEQRCRGPHRSILTNSTEAGSTSGARLQGLMQSDDQ